MNIEICKICNGNGEIMVDVGARSTEYVNKTCKECNGTGRVKTRTYSYSVPFDTDNNKIYENDTKIIELIRNIQLTKANEQKIKPEPPSDRILKEGEQPAIRKKR